MFNNLTFGCTEVPIRVNGMGFLIHSGGLMEKELSREVIGEALESLPEELLRRLWEFNKLYPVVINKGNMKNPLAAAFFPFSQEECGILLTVSFFRKKLRPGNLYHELVHYRQWRRGDLQPTCSVDTVEWKGKEWVLDTGYGIQYIKTPWEQEAYRAQFEWEKESGRSRLTPNTRMGLAMFNIRARKFMEGIGGRVFFAMFYLALAVVTPGTGWWWALKGFFGFSVVDQIFGIALKLREKMKVKKLHVTKESGMG